MARTCRRADSEFQELGFDCGALPLHFHFEDGGLHDGDAALAPGGDDQLLDEAVFDGVDGLEAAEEAVLMCGEGFGVLVGQEDEMLRGEIVCGGVP